MNKRTHVVLLVVLSGSILMMNGCAMTKEKNGPVSLYKSEEAKTKSYASYDRTMELWGIDYIEDWIPTTYGLTHMIKAGPEDGKPVLLFPGLFADASMWYANAGKLAETYRVLSVDLPVYGGKSQPSEVKITGIEDYSVWFSEILDFYGYSRAAVGGLSYGSWLSLALAREVPEKIASIIMLDPSTTFISMRSSMAWKGFQYFMFFPNRDKYRKFFDWMGGGYSDPGSDIWLEHMIDVIDYGTVGMMDVPQHRIYQPEELQMVNMPVIILIGGKPIIYENPQEFTEVAARALPHAEIGIIPDTGHSLNIEKPDQVNNRIIRFLDANY